MSRSFLGPEVPIPKLMQEKQQKAIKKKILKKIQTNPKVPEFKAAPSDRKLFDTQQFEEEEPFDDSVNFYQKMFSSKPAKKISSQPSSQPQADKNKPMTVFRPIGVRNTLGSQKPAEKTSIVEEFTIIGSTKETSNDKENENKMIEIGTDKKAIVKGDVLVSTNKSEISVEEDSQKEQAEIPKNKAKKEKKGKKDKSDKKDKKAKKSKRKNVESLDDEENEEKESKKGSKSPSPAKADPIDSKSKKIHKFSNKQQENYVRLDLKKKFKDRYRGEKQYLKSKFRANGRMKINKKLRNELERKAQEERENKRLGINTYDPETGELIHPLHHCPYITKNLLPYALLTPEDPQPEPLCSVDLTSTLLEAGSFLKTLKEKFGHQTFRSGQLESIQRVLNQQSTLVVLSTGTGKSLIYQYCSHILSGLTVVVSPLLSLMNDQLKKLPPCLTGVCFNSNLNYDHKKLIMPLIKQGHVKILYMSPEYLSRETFEGFPPINFVCIDEAHCISEWSHNFRTSYFLLSSLISKKFGNVPILGLTATATLKTQNSILRILKLSEDSIVRAPTVMRENLFLSVSRDHDIHKGVLTLIKSPRYKQFKSIIIYCMMKRTVEALAQNLAQNGINAVPYHAEMPESRRLQVQEGFMQNKYRIVVATVAFGMGIDKPDVRAVIHVNMPRSMENYIQEIGRSGRDGKPAYCHLFLSDEMYFRMRGLMYGEVVERNTVMSIIKRIITSNHKKNSVKKRKFDEVEEEQPTLLEPEELEITKEVLTQEGDMDVTKLTKKRLFYLKTADLASETGMKSETITTILMELDKHNPRFFEFKNFGQVICRIGFYKSQPEELKEKYDIIRVILDNSRSFKGLHKFNLCEIANILLCDTYDILKELQKLEQIHEISYDLEDDGYLYNVSFIPSQDEQNDITNHVYSKIKEYEMTNISKLDFIYSLMRLYAKPNTDFLLKSGELSDKREGEKIVLQDQAEEFHLEIAPKESRTLLDVPGGAKIGDLIDAYFSVESRESYPEIIGRVQNMDDVLPLIKITPEMQPAIVVMENFSFESLERHNQYTGKSAFDSIGFRKISKILQGINSKETAVSEWKRNHYWEKYYDHDHEGLTECIKDAVITYLMEVATLESKKVKENDSQTN